MRRIKSLGRYQKAILLIVAVMVLVFTVVYAVTIAREGFLYKGKILVPEQKNSNTVYSGKINGKPVNFTVYSDKTLEFRYGEKIYGPYTAKEDSTAIPKEIDMADSMTGVELRHGDKIIFRGGMFGTENSRWLYNEDGSIEDMIFSMNNNIDVESDENGNIIDSMEPSASVIIDLMFGPKLTHKGQWHLWFLGVFLCITTAVFILFAEELFRWNLTFFIRDADRAEPSDWEITRRYITWTVLPIIAVGFFIIGLR